MQDKVDVKCIISCFLRKVRDREFFFDILKFVGDEGETISETNGTPLSKPLDEQRRNNFSQFFFKMTDFYTFNIRIKMRTIHINKVHKNIMGDNVLHYFIMHYGLSHIGTHTCICNARFSSLMAQVFVHFCMLWFLPPISDTSA